MDDIKQDAPNSATKKIKGNKRDTSKNESHQTTSPQRLPRISEASDLDVPDGGYGWIIVAVSFLTSTVVDGAVNSFGIFLSELAKEYDVPDGKIATVAWVGSILAGVTLLVGPLAGAMTNKFGCRITCIVGSILTAASFGVSIFCPTVTFLMATYFVAGVGLGLILLPSVVIVGYYFESKRALATGIALSGSGFGTTIFPPVGNFIIKIGGWKVANLCLAATGLCCVVLGVLMRPLKPKTVFHDIEYKLQFNSKLSKNAESKSTIDVSFSNMAEYMLYKQRNNQISKVESLEVSRNRSQSNVAEYYTYKRRNINLTRKEIFYSGSLMQLNIPRQKNSESFSKDSIKSVIDINLLKDKKFLLYGLVNIFAMISFYIPLVYIVNFAETKGIAAEEASFLISVVGIVNTVARIGFGYIVNFPSVDSIFVNNICLLVGAAAVALIPFCESFVSYIFASLFFGVSIAAYSSLTPIILVDLLGLGQLTNGFGIIQLFRGIMALLGTPMAGALRDWTNSYSVPFFAGGGLFLLSAFFGFILQYINRKSTKISIERVT